MEQIINANGSQYGMTVNPDGSINTVVSGISIDIGSAIFNLEDVYVVSGNINTQDTIPTDSHRYNPQTVIEYSGTAIGSVYKINNLGSFVKVLVYDGSDNLVNVSEWQVI